MPTPRYRHHLGGRESLQEADIDRALRTLREADGPQTASDIASALGLSRPTAQRYLADLAAAGRADVTLRYSTAGRPEHRYAWRGGR